jgi:integrase
MPKTAVEIIGTDRELRAIRPAGKRLEYRDSTVKNLRIRVTPSGLISFALLVRPKRGGNASRRRLGDYGRITNGVFQQGRLTLKAARRLATTWNAKFQTGVDPKAEEIEATKQRRAEKLAGTAFEVVVNDYLKRRVVGKDSTNPKIRRAKETRQLLQFFTNAWVNRPVRSIGADEIEVLLEPKAEIHPAMARNLFATLRAMFNWASRKREYRPLANPCDSVDIDMLGVKSIRRRVLSHDELRLFARNVRRLPYPFRSLYQLLLLTGLRLNEAARAEWREFDFGINMIWEIPASRMKGRLAHVVPITPDILELLHSLPRPKNARFVFSTTAGSTPISGFSKVKARLDARMARSLRALARKRKMKAFVSIPRWVNHDVRRTFRTEMSSMGNSIPQEVREALLAHTKQGIVGVYDQYQYRDEKHVALSLWATRIRTILETPMSDLQMFKPDSDNRN